MTYYCVVNVLQAEGAAIEMMLGEGPHKLLFPDFKYDTIEYITKSYEEICDGSTIFLEVSPCF
jgi:hypothetical protein